jgi:CubicO group peptidase (beta-lactamase class C family)
MKRLDAYEMFSGAILVAEDGDVIYRNAFGHADREWQVPNTVDTRFRIGSITKPFTAILVFQLIEEGKLSLDGKIVDYLPDYPRPNGERVTLRHLLGHRSGIPNYLRDVPEFTNGESAVPYLTHTPEGFVELFSEMDLRFEPGSQFEYCNSGYYLLGAIIEEVTRKSYALNLEERILRPAGMTASGYPEPGEVVPKHASGYYQEADGYRNARPINTTVFYAAGGMYSTVEDLYRWDQALHSDVLLPEKAKGQMFERQFTNERTGGGYAYGWDVMPLVIDGLEDPLRTVGHAGDNPGFFGVVVRFVDDGDFIVFLTNTNAMNIRSMRGLVTAIASILHDAPYEMPRCPLVRPLLAVIHSGGVDAAVTQYRIWKRDDPEVYDFGESQLNALGYQLLGSGRAEEAVKIFRLNVEVYPEAFNTYDSLGEGYMALGDNDRAIANYRKSLELNPENSNAVDVLKRLEEK